MSALFFDTALTGCRRDDGFDILSLPSADWSMGRIDRKSGPCKLPLPKAPKTFYVVTTTVAGSSSRKLLTGGRRSFSMGPSRFDCPSSESR